LRDLWLALLPAKLSLRSDGKSWKLRRVLRLAQQIPDEKKSALCDYVLTNGGPLTELEWQVDQLWPILKAAAE